MSTILGKDGHGASIVVSVSKVDGHMYRGAARDLQRMARPAPARFTRHRDTTDSHAVKLVLLLGQPAHKHSSGGFVGIAQKIHFEQVDISFIFIF